MTNNNQDPLNETDKHLPTRRTLLSRLRNRDDQEHWALFFRLKQCQILDLCCFKQWPMAKVARKLGINPGRVYWARKKITRRLQQAVAELREKPL
jgi:hypothetical protein